MLRWTLPAHFGGREQLRLRAWATQRPELDAALTVALHPGPPAALESAFDGRELLADGLSQAELRVRVLDAHRNPTRADGLSLSAALGTLGPLTEARDAAGVAYVASYRAPRSAEARADEIAIHLPGAELREHAVLALRPLPRPVQVGLQLGYLTNLGRVAAPWAALGLALRVPELLDARLLVTMRAAGFWREQRLAAAAEGGASEALTLRVRGLPLLLGLTYEHPVRRVRLRGGLALGAYLLDRAVRSASAGELGEAGATWALGAQLGLGLALGPGQLTAQLGYDWARLRGGLLPGTYGGLLASAGYLFETGW